MRLVVRSGDYPIKRNKITLMLRSVVCLSTSLARVETESPLRGLKETTLLHTRRPFLWRLPRNCRVGFA